MDPALDDRPLTGGDIGTLQRAINDRVGAAISAAGFAGVSLAHKPILLNLTVPRRIGELAGLAGVTKNAVVYLVNQLEDGGYVERVPDPTDGRATVVRLTELGRQVGSTVAQALTKMADEWKSVLGGENEWISFRIMLRRLASHESHRPAVRLPPGRRPHETH